jgi:hypothetical protein
MDISYNVISQSERAVGSFHCRSSALCLRDLANCAYMGRPQSIQPRDVVPRLWPDRRIFHRLALYGSNTALAPPHQPIAGLKRWKIHFERSSR